MASFKIDPNRWQEIYPASSPGSDLFGTLLFNSTDIPNFITGGVFMHPPASPGFSQQWQIFPLTNTTYVLRTKDSGPKGFLNTQDIPSLPGGVTVDMRNSTTDDKGMLWNVGTWPDGSLYFTNVANGTGLFLTAIDSGGTGMGANKSVPEDGHQSWGVRQGETIDDSAYSVVLGTPLYTASTASSTSTSSPAPTSSSASVVTSAPAQSTSPSTNRTGLSPGAAAGTGVGVSAVALIAIASLVFFFLRKRKAKKGNFNNNEESQIPPPSYEPYTHTEVPKAELASVQMPKAELASPVQEPAEIGVEIPVAELAGDER